ncbi:MAG: hypothetical protein H0V17_35250 [Deltaproteobacteria bacterium]|nr:hypothetical protein [Deltaproteobacteria bacterium]
MAFEQEQKAALRILEGIENGTMSAADSSALVEEADPTLVYLIFTWLRAHYGPDDPASDAVIGRLVAISNRPAVAKLAKVGQTDPVVEWFEDAYSYRKLGSKEFIELVVEKLEG